MGKNFFKDGKWIDNPDEITVIECECGGKYIKTRKEQSSCLRCMSQVK